MLHEVQEQIQVPTPLLVQYRIQLNGFIQQREQARLQFEQLQGCVFACEQMIKQYEENAKQAAMDLVNKIADADPLKPNENLGVINDGKADHETKKQASQK
jgi:hypothetical protein